MFLFQLPIPMTENSQIFTKIAPTRAIYDCNTFHVIHPRVKHVEFFQKKVEGGRNFADRFHLSLPILKQVFEVRNYQKWNFWTFSKNSVQKWCAKKMILWRKKISKKKGQKIGKNSLILVLYHGFFPFFSQKLFFLVKNPKKNMKKFFFFFWNFVFVDCFSNQHSFQSC